jgi:hypothetical protein
MLTDKIKETSNPWKLFPHGSYGVNNREQAQKGVMQEPIRRRESFMQIRMKREARAFFSIPEI